MAQQAQPPPPPTTQPAQPPAPPKPNPNSAASSTFQRLDPDVILDPNYSTRTLFAHVVRLFFLSYPEMDEQSLERGIYRKKLTEYLQTVQDLYGISFQDWTVLSTYLKTCSSRNYLIYFAVKRFTGRTDGKNLVFYVRNNSTGQSVGQIGLSSRKEIQERYIQDECSYDQLRQLRQQNAVFRLSVADWSIADDQSGADAGQQAFKEHLIDMGRIHPEGHQQWFDFGQGVRLLIEIIFKLKLSSSVEDEMFFHVHTLFRMIDRRLIANTRPNVWHKPMQMKTHRISYARPLVTESGMFWRTTHQKWSELRRSFVQKQTDPDIQQNIRQLSDRQTVLHFDFQRSPTFGEDVDGRVCLCNEWCNWNAFFHYNPIYRFIIVQNSNLYFDRNAFNVPEMYLAASVRQTTSQHVNRGLVLPLVTSADLNRLKVTHRYMSNQADMITYASIRPSGVNPLFMVGVCYNTLRYHPDIASLIQHVNNNPFDDICVQNLVDHIRVISDLHFVVSMSPPLVPIVDRTNWEKEMFKINRRPVGFFFIRAYSAIFQANFTPDPTITTNVLSRMTHDRVFGSDIEYLTYLPQNDSEMSIKYYRMKALQYSHAVGQTGNALNMSVEINPFINCYKEIYKFFSVIDSQLPAANTKESLEDVSHYCIKFDTDLQLFNSTQPTTKFTVSYQELNSSGLSQDKHHLIYAFYTLKLYSFGFVIQKHCLSSRARLLGKRENVGIHCLKQMADSFSLIFDNPILEQTYQSISKQELFDSFSYYFYQVFYNFYHTFWTRPPPQPTYWQICQSALTQYQKLYVWLKSGGNDRPIFTVILREFGESLWYILDRSVEISTDMVMPAIVWLDRDIGFEYSIEVMDVLTLYLIRASCHRILSAVSEMFKELHQLQDQNLFSQFMSFSMCEPGWTLHLKTMDKVIVILDRLRDQFIVFDDEIERISDSLTTCQWLSKQFYRHMYTKLCHEWLKEIERIIILAVQTPLPPPAQVTLDQLITLQAVVGLSFMASFINLHRKEFNRIRLNWFRLFNTNKSIVPFQSFVAIETTVGQYLKDTEAMRRGKSLQCKLWHDFVVQKMPFLDQLSATDVGLDLSQAYPP